MTDSFRRLVLHNFGLKLISLALAVGLWFAVAHNRLTRQVDIRPRVVGAVAPGYQMGRVVVDPPTITISGPRKQVELVDAVTTDPVDVSGIMERSTFATHAYVSDPLVQVVHPGSIRVTVIMEKVPAAAAGGR